MSTYSEGDAVRIILLKSNGAGGWIPVDDPVSTGSGTALTIRVNDVDADPAEDAINFVDTATVEWAQTDDTPNGETELRATVTVDGTDVTVDPTGWTGAAGATDAQEAFDSLDLTDVAISEALVDHIAIDNTHSYVLESLLDTKGDLITATAGDTPAKLAAGSNYTSLIADSNETSGLRWSHGTPLMDKYMQPAGALVETVPRIGSIFSGQAFQTSGRVQMCAIALPKGLTVTNITFLSGATAQASSTHCWFFLADEDYEQLRSTADDTAASPWGAATLKTMALITPYVIPADGLYYIGNMSTASTVANQAVVNSNLAAVNSAVLPAQAVAGLTGQTVPVADGTDLAPTPTVFGWSAYGYVS